MVAYVIVGIVISMITFVTGVMMGCIAHDSFRIMCGIVIALFTIFGWPLVIIFNIYSVIAYLTSKNRTKFIVKVMEEDLEIFNDYFD